MPEDSITYHHLMAYMMLIVSAGAAVLLEIWLGPSTSWLLSAMATCLVAGWALRRHIPWLAFTALLLATFAGFVWRTGQVWVIPAEQRLMHDHQVVEVTGVAQAPQRSDTSEHVWLSHVQIREGSKRLALRSQVQLILPLYSNISYGDKVSAEAAMHLASAESDAGYRQYLLNHQVIATLVRPKIHIIGHGQGNPIVAAGWSAEQSIESRVQRLLPKDEAALLIGIVLGVPHALSSSFSDALKQTGTTHIVVASGYNVSIVIGVCLAQVKILGRRNATILAIISIACYVLIAGANPSIVRAAIMAGLVFVGTEWGRQRQAINLLCITAMLMLLYQPLWLLDTSFQLSFAATLGILLFQPAIESHMNKLPSWLGETISTTLAAQIFVWPILVCTFGQFSLLGSIANILVLWLVPAVMAGGLVVVIASLIWSPIAWMAAMVIHPLLAYIIHAILFFSRLPLSFMSLALDWKWASLYYAFALIVWRWQEVKHESVE